MRVRIQRSEFVSPFVKQIDFVSATSAEFPGFRPGAHAIFASTHKEEAVERRYTIISDPEDRTGISIAVLDRGPGTFSGHIAKLDVGEELELQGIRGEIKIPRDIQTAVLIAGGVGVTLILSVARELARMRVPLEIHYAARSQPHLSFLDDLQAVELSVLKTYTPDLQEFRRMDIRTILTEADRDAHIYVCGPYSMIEETRQVASEIGFLDRRVHFESFGSFWKPDDRDLTVHLKQSEMTIRVPVGTSILDAMLAQGVWASFECKRGECGDCSVGFSGGVADHRDHALSSDARSSMICTCVSWAKTDSIELDL